MKFVRMISPAKDVGEINFSEHGIFHPRDDGSYSIPEVAVGEAQKANLELAPLSQSQRLARVLAELHPLDVRLRIFRHAKH
jgi:hypothetical protein